MAIMRFFFPKNGVLSLSAMKTRRLWASLIANVTGTMSPERWEFHLSSYPMAKLVRLLHEVEGVNSLEYTYQESKTAEAALDLAVAKQALLVTSWRLWTWCHGGDIRLWLPWWRHSRETYGRESVYVAPMLDKTNWRLHSASHNEWRLHNGK